MYRMRLKSNVTYLIQQYININAKIMQKSENNTIELERAGQSTVL